MWGSIPVFKEACLDKKKKKSRKRILVSSVCTDSELWKRHRVLGQWNAFLHDWGHIWIRTGENWNRRTKPGHNGLAFCANGFGKVELAWIFQQMARSGLCIHSIGDWRLDWSKENLYSQITRKEAGVIIQRRDNGAPSKDKTVAIRSGVGFRHSFSGGIERIGRLMEDSEGEGQIPDASHVSSSKDWTANFTGRQAGRRQFWREGESNLSLRWLWGLWLKCLAKESWMQIWESLTCRLQLIITAMDKTTQGKIVNWQEAWWLRGLSDPSAQGSLGFYLLSDIIAHSNLFDLKSVPFGQ